MAEHKNKTDKKHDAPLESQIFAAVWQVSTAKGGDTVYLEVSTKYVGNGSPIELQIEDGSGKKVSKLKGKVIGDKYISPYTIPEDGKGEWWFTAKLPKHGLQLKSAGTLKVVPQLKLCNLAWDRADANFGDIVKITADVENATDGTETIVELLYHDPRGAHVPVEKLLTTVNANKIQASWEFKPKIRLKKKESGTSASIEFKDEERDYFFRVILGSIAEKSGALKYRVKPPKAEVKWSKKEVTPNHNNAWPPVSPPTDTVPEEAKVEITLECQNIPDETGVTVKVLHCKSKATIATLSGLKIKGDKLVDGATNKAPVWTFDTVHKLWDPWNAPFYYLQAEIDLDVNGKKLALETERDYTNKPDEVLRQLYWSVCISDAIADRPAGGNLTTAAEMNEIAGLITAKSNHRVFTQAVNQANVPIGLWGSVLRNSYAYHHASHGDIVNPATGAQLNDGTNNPPTVAVGSWRSVVVLGNTNLGAAQIDQAANIPATPRYLVYMDTCVAGWEPSLGNAFRARGTQHFLAFRKYIPDGDARQMARDFYKKWRDQYDFNPDKIASVFWDVGGSYYGSMRPVLNGPSGGQIKEGSSAWKTALTVLGVVAAGAVVGAGIYALGKKKKLW